VLSEKNHLHYGNQIPIGHNYQTIGSKDDQTHTHTDIHTQTKRHLEVYLSDTKSPPVGVDTLVLIT